MATVTIRNMNDLSKIFEARISMALKMTQDRIYKVIQEHISDYYHEKVFRGSAIPEVYDRQYKFLNSLIKTNMVATSTGLSCTVEVDPYYLAYKYPGGASGTDVWSSANEKFHGWSIEGDMRVWDDAMAELGLEYGIKDLMKTNLKKCGIPIR